MKKLMLALCAFFAICMAPAAHADDFNEVSVTMPGMALKIHCLIDKKSKRHMLMFQGYLDKNVLKESGSLVINKTAVFDNIDSPWLQVLHNGLSDNQAVVLYIQKDTGDINAARSFKGVNQWSDGKKSAAATRAQDVDAQAVPCEQVSTTGGYLKAPPGTIRRIWNKVTI